MFNDEMLVFVFVFWRHCVTAQPYLAVLFKHFLNIPLRKTCHTTWKRYFSRSLILLSLSILVDRVNPESTAPFYILSQMKTP